MAGDVGQRAEHRRSAVYRAVGRPDLAAVPEYVDRSARQRSAAEIDALVAEWVGERTLDEAMKVFDRPSGVAAAPVYDAEQLLADEQFRASGHIRRGRRPGLGSVTVQAPVAVLSETPGRVEHLGRALGADNDEVYGDLFGLDADRYRRRCVRRARSMMREARDTRARRSELATPASNEHMCAKVAARAGADLVFLDLEDACAPRRRSRPGRRRSMRSPDLDWGRTVRAVRINGVDTPLVPRRRGRDRHRRARCAGRDHRAEGAHAPGTCGGSTSCSPSSNRSWGCSSGSPSKCSSRRPKGW